LSCKQNGGSETQEECESRFGMNGYNIVD
jgi:hypothetical protein